MAPGPAMIDVAFAVEGEALPREHRFALDDALLAALPWLAGEPHAGVHRLNVVGGGGDDDLITRRTRLTLRVPRVRAQAATALAGVPLQVGPRRLCPGRPTTRELLAHGTLYAPLVVADGPDEAAFLRAVQRELDMLGVRGQAICGRWQCVEAGRLLGCSLMLTGLDAAQSLVLLQQGLGPHRRLGCGLFVPHRSAAAVGAPA